MTAKARASAESSPRSGESSEVSGAPWHYLLATIVILGFAAAWWSGPARRRALAKAPRASAALGLGCGSALVFCLWSVHSQAPALSYEQPSEPIAIAIAFDLSPSMLAIPDPAAVPQADPRYLRGRDALLTMLRSMEARDRAALVCIVGFARSGEVIMGWSRSVAQADEVIRHVLSPEVFGRPGTSMEAAAKSLAEAFDMLPATFETARRIAIVVSDGEDTMRGGSLGYAVDLVERAGFDLIALQTGSLDVDEGVPVYDRAGRFTGFERIAQRTVTRPDPAAMRALASAGEARGMHVRAEAADASSRMLEFAYGDGAATRPFDAVLAPTLGMFGAILFLLGWIVR